MKLETLHDLFVNELRDLYHAEQQLVMALPKLADSVASDDLRSAFEAHVKQTEDHVDRLEEVFQLLDEKPVAKICRAVQGLIEEGAEILEEQGEPSVLDAGVIVAAQKIEHYEMAGYGSVRSFADLLGQDEAAQLLQDTLDEESQANEFLNQLATNPVNPDALRHGGLSEANSER